MRDLKEKTHGRGQADPLVTGKCQNLDVEGKAEGVELKHWFKKYKVCTNLMTGIGRN